MPGSNVSALTLESNQMEKQTRLWLMGCEGPALGGDCRAKLAELINDSNSESIIQEALIDEETRSLLLKQIEGLRPVKGEGE